MGAGRVTPPATTLGGIAYGASTNADTALVALLVGPTRAAIYDITSKAARYARAFTDTVSFSVYGSFAHLSGSRERSAAAGVFREVEGLRTNLTMAVVAVVLALNGPFIRIWTGDEFYGGWVLSLWFSLRVLISGWSFLVNYLYRATGAVVGGSLLLAIESGLALSAGALALAVSKSETLMVVGMMGVSLPFALFVRRRLLIQLGVHTPPQAPAEPPRFQTVSPYAAVALVGGVLLCFVNPTTSSPSQFAVLVGCVGASVAGLGLMARRHGASRGGVLRMPPRR